jgi:hypothetical protein
MSLAREKIPLDKLQLRDVGMYFKHACPAILAPQRPLARYDQTSTVTTMVDKFTIPLPALVKLGFDIAQFPGIFGPEKIARYPAHHLLGGIALELFHALGPEAYVATNIADQSLNELESLQTGLDYWWCLPVDQSIHSPGSASSAQYVNYGTLPKAFI